MFEKDKLEELKKEKKEWEEGSLKKVLDKFAERKDEFMSISDAPIERLYTPEEVEGLDYSEKIGYPGQFPFTRGVQPTMYRGRLWTMRQYAGFGSAEDTNKRYKYLLDQGQTGLSVAFDLPTQMGYDSDHQMALGEVGKCGVSISSLKDMETLFDGIPLDKVSTSMTINSTAAILLAMYIAVAEKQGVTPDKITGTIQNDLLKEYIARGTYIFPPAPSMRIVTDIFDYCSKNVPRWNTISISGYHIREAGSTAAQELAFTLANGMTYVDSAIKKGLDVDKFAPRLSFFFNSHNDFFEEIAKFRAARRIWAKIMTEKFGAKNPKSMMLRFHTQTAGCSLTAQQPYNNIIRTTLEALSAVLGGTQSLHTNSMDEAFALPSEESVKVALRTQQVIGFESGVANTIDPLAGSYFIEAMTDKIEKEVLEYFDKIEALGGVLTALERGFFHKEIADASYRYQKEVEAAEKIVVGVNKFTTGEETQMNLLKVDPGVQKKQEDQIKALKDERDNKKVEELLEGIEQAAKGDENLIPYITEAVKEYATLGEICDILRDVFGEYKEQTVF